MSQSCTTACRGKTTMLEWAKVPRPCKLFHVGRQTRRSINFQEIVCLPAASRSRSRSRIASKTLHQRKHHTSLTKCKITAANKARSHSISVKFVELSPLPSELHQRGQRFLLSKPLFASAFAFRGTTWLSQHGLHTQVIMKLEAGSSRLSLYLRFSLHPPAWFRRGFWIRQSFYSSRRHWKTPFQS